MALQGLLGRDFGHTNITLETLASAAGPPGTERFLGVMNAAYKITGVAGEYVTFNCPVLATSPTGSIIQVIQWNGLGTVRFALVAGSSDTINGGAGPVSFAEADYGSGTLLLCFGLANGYHVIAIREDSAGSIVDAISPNIQVTAGDNVDAGHYAGDGKLYLAPTISSAAAPTLGAKAVCLSDASGRTHGADSVVAGSVTANVGADSIGLGKVSAALNGVAGGPAIGIGNVSGAVGVNGIAMGETSGTIGTGSTGIGVVVGNVGNGGVVVGNNASAVGTNAVMCGSAVGAVGNSNVVVGTAGSTCDGVMVGSATGAVSAGGVLCGTNTSTTAAAGVAVGNMTAAVPAGAVCLGNGAPVGATKLQFIGIDGM